MNNGLSDTKNQENAFYDLQKAISENDYSKIDELMKAPEEAPAAAETQTEVVETTETQEDTTASPVAETTETGQSNPESQVTEVQTDQTTVPVDELAALKKQLEAATAQIHRYKSDAGRVPSLQKRLAELEKRVTPEKDGSTPGSTKPDALNDDDKRVLDSLRQNDPVLADHIEQLTANLKKENGNLRQQFEERLRTADKEEYETIVAELERIEFDRLAEMVPQVDLPTVFSSPQWQQWKRGLRPSDRAYAESSNADEVFAAIQWFGQAMQAAHPQIVAAPTPATPAPTAVPTPVAAPKVRSGVAAQQTGRALTEDEAFSQVWKEIGERDGLNQPKLR